MRTKLVIAVIAMLAGLVLAALGQTPTPAPTPPSYKPTHEQQLELENLQLKAQLAQRALQDAQRAFQQSLLDLTQKAEQVKTANKWDAKTQFDPNTLTFSAPPPEPDKPPTPSIDKPALTPEKKP